MLVIGSWPIAPNSRCCAPICCAPICCAPKCCDAPSWSSNCCERGACWYWAPKSACCWRPKPCSSPTLYWRSSLWPAFFRSSFWPLFLNIFPAADIMILAWCWNKSREGN
ncbi:AFL126Wp [Eremothecium gossypii ATCC 10895]|uniref:AFL126Wp n=1 Tax=Eremothecium gossypii (strain ATCC 10895 / CBS 109.51 / FGSC 9923 / NRRL Y-1056) TaxID=284811 RepID=Q755E9_EREGS|nr:AFL126Wp [Eremothecium gossypii ATCC 10895]AAS53248.2 AFL126Wp [Eremothecium gossypii ATCC 10895]AEY97558.1 FAFL126Wp [Eremothecium gossypii FDAG1]